LLSPPASLRATTPNSPVSTLFTAYIAACGKDIPGLFETGEIIEEISFSIFRLSFFISHWLCSRPSTMTNETSEMETGK
jgi:hypothetical protein